MSFHAASGALAVTVTGMGVVILRCAPYTPSLPVVTLVDRRVRKPLAAHELSTVQGRIASFDALVRAAAAKERALVSEIDGLKERRTQY